LPVIKLELYPDPGSDFENESRSNCAKITIRPVVKNGRQDLIFVVCEIGQTLVDLSTSQIGRALLDFVYTHSKEVMRHHVVHAYPGPLHKRIATASLPPAGQIRNLKW